MTKNELIEELQGLFGDITITPHIQNTVPGVPRKRYIAIISTNQTIHFYVENEDEQNENAYYMDTDPFTNKMS